MPEQMTIQQAVNLAMEHHQAGRLAQAEAVYRQILAANPDQPEILFLLSLVLVSSGREPAARELMVRSVALRPTNPDAQALLGSLLLSNGQVDQAIAHLRQAIAINPALAEPYSNLGIALKMKKQTEPAIAALREAVRLRPTFAEAYSNLGNTLKDADRIDEAMQAYQTAVQQRPELPEARNHLGQMLHLKGRTDEAIEQFNAAIKLRPNFAEAHNNLGVSFLAQGKYDQARAEFEQALKCRPDYASAHHNLSMMMLLAGDYERGWIENEWRWKVPELNLMQQKFAQPTWDGSDLNGKRILLHSDQAFGDAIQFSRYVPLVAQRGGKVLLAVQPALQRLMRSLDGVEEVLTHGDPVPQFDVHCPTASLPRVFRTTTDTIPKSIPYLRAHAELAAKWHDRIGEQRGLKIGLVWAGRTTPNPLRSIDLAELAPLAEIPDINFFSLQKGAGAAQAKNPPGKMTLYDWTEELADFAETAALIDNLDLLVTIDTAVGHLAGAMGKRVLMLVPFVPDWRWMLDRGDSIWYPTIQLFRQPAIGDWRTPITEIVRTLESHKINNP